MIGKIGWEPLVDIESIEMRRKKMFDGLYLNTCKYNYEATRNFDRLDMALVVIKRCTTKAWKGHFRGHFISN